MGAKGSPWWMPGNAYKSYIELSTGLISELLDYRLSDKEMQVLIEGDWIPIDYSSFKDIDVALHDEYQSWPQDVGYSGSGNFHSFYHSLGLLCKLISIKIKCCKLYACMLLQN